VVSVSCIYLSFLLSLTVGLQLGVSATENSNIPYERLELSVREDLDASARRTFVVLDPLKVTITNYPGTGLAGHLSLSLYFFLSSVYRC
jgi:hypothetical protein